MTLYQDKLHQVHVVNLHIRVSSLFIMSVHLSTFHAFPTQRSLLASLLFSGHSLHPFVDARRVIIHLYRQAEWNSLGWVYHSHNIKKGRERTKEKRNTEQRRGREKRGGERRGERRGEEGEKEKAMEFYVKGFSPMSASSSAHVLSGPSPSIRLFPT